MRLHDDGASAEIQEFMGYDQTDHDGALTRFALPNRAGAKTIDVETAPSAPLAEQGAGFVHHIAFAVAFRARQLEVRKALLDADCRVTPMIDRDYFWSIYFRAPGGVLFEIATNEPGFDRDEDADRSGETLILPAQHAHPSHHLERTFEPLNS